jgi:hypothetical protein
MPLMYYSPRIERQLVSKLYWESQSQKIPMTKLANRLIAEGLGRYCPKRTNKIAVPVRVEQLFLDL